MNVVPVGSQRDGPSFGHEFNVPDPVEARRELEAKGCDRYMRGPLGLLFNLWEEPGPF